MIPVTSSAPINNFSSEESPLNSGVRSAMNAAVNIALGVFATGRTVPRVSSGGVGCSSVQHRKQVGGSYAQQGSGENLQRVLNLTIRELVHDWQCVRFAHLPSRSPLAFLLWACYKKSAQNRDGDEMRKKKRNQSLYFVSKYRTRHSHGPELFIHEGSTNS